MKEYLQSMPKSLGVISITPWGAREICDEPGMAAHACGHSTWEIEAGESGVQGWLGYIVSLSLGFMRLSLKTQKQNKQATGKTGPGTGNTW